MDADGSNASTIYGGESGWNLCPTQSQILTGQDRTVYIVQVKTTSPYSQRLVALKDGSVRWIRNFPTGDCNHSPAQIFNLAMGFDGNIYADVSWSGSSPCVGTLALVGIDSASGAVHFQTALPDSNSATAHGLYNNEIMPYDNGIAVVNNGVNVYYYSYAGVQDSSKTFTPTGLGTGSTPQWVSVTANGRVYLNAYGYVSSVLTIKLFYKDVSSSTIHEISAPSGRDFSWMYATPSNGVALLLTNSSNSSHYYLGYFDNTGTEVYEKDLNSETGATLRAGTKPSLAVDNNGNAIVVRTMSLSASPNDQVIYVDSFNSTGTGTRLYDSGATFGTSGQDTFTIGAWGGQGLGDGTIFLVQCQQGSVYTAACPSTGNPKIIKIPFSGSFDYPRSAAFTVIGLLTHYVALGDSYSSGEGNPPFIAPTDNNGGDACDRSESTAYPVLLPPDIGFKLDAFVACSGATSSDIISGMNGEPSQLNALDANTDIVTVTAGGDDAEFADFAAECVIGTCDSGSAQYQTTMEIIDDPLLLQASLETLFADIRAAAPNAAIKVIGYPAAVGGNSCPIYLSSGEQIAIDTVVTSLNNVSLAAVNNSGSGFQFIDPNTTGSPFNGHDLCTSNSYLFGLNIAEHRFSFHPNADGQTAYEELIANLI
jgi:hypothetical protein